MCKARHVTPAGRDRASSVLERQSNPMQRQTRGAVATFHPRKFSRGGLNPYATRRLRLPSNPHDRMLGYPIVFIDRMLCVNRHSNARSLSPIRPFLLLTALVLAQTIPPARMAYAQQIHF